MSPITVLLLCLLQVHLGMSASPTRQPTLSELIDELERRVNQESPMYSLENLQAGHRSLRARVSAQSALATGRPHNEPLQAIPIQITNSSRLPTASLVGPSHMLPNPPLQALPYGFWRHLPKLLGQSFRHDFDVRRQWLAIEDVPLEELRAAKMVHESLLSHVDSIRCPVYAMVFKWLVDTRSDLGRRNDHQRVLTRYNIQMLAFRVALEPRFYHDVFFASKFGSVVGRFASTAKRLEEQVMYANEMDVWFDLIGCLLEYGGMPHPEGPGPETSQQLKSFLSHDRRRRLVARMLRFRGRRNQRPSQQDMARLLHVSDSVPYYEMMSYFSVVALMDKDTINEWQRFVRNPFAYAARHNPPTAPTYPLWPAPEDPVATHDPMRDFKLLPIQVVKFPGKDTMRWVEKLGNLEVFALNEPHLSPLAPIVLRDQMSPSELEPRTLKHLLEDIATFYNIRLRLIRESGYGQPATDRLEGRIWSPLPIESSLELTIVVATSPILRETMGESVDSMYSQLERYKTFGRMLDSLIDLSHMGFNRYRRVIDLMRPLVSSTNLVDLKWERQLLDVLVNLIDLSVLRPSVVFEVDPPAQTREVAESSVQAARRNLRE